MSELKARDIIPEWPRGRSTSRPCAAGSAWPWEYAYSLISGELLHVGNRTEWQGLGRSIPESVHRATKRIGWGEYERYQDYMAERAEEERKAEMMEGYRREQMDLACGKIPSTWDDCFRWWYEKGYQSEADRHIVRGYLP